MNRRAFIFRTAGLALTAYVAPTLARAAAEDKMDRIAMGTLIMRYRFKQTKPKEMATIPNELTLPEVAQYYRDRFKVRQIEFWSNHFESIEPAYLAKVLNSIKAVGSKLVDVQFDFDYDLAAPSESKREESVKTVKQWIDACAFLGSECVRVNPGRPRGSVDNSIKSLKEVAGYAKSKNIVVITANHFGLEMNPDVHVKVVKEVGENIYTEPDFGNYPPKTMFDSLAKIIPYAFLGQLDTTNFATSLVLLPFVPVGVRLGVIIQGKLEERVFYQISYWALLALGIKLVYDGVTLP